MPGEIEILSQGILKIWRVFLNPGMYISRNETDSGPISAKIVKK